MKATAMNRPTSAFVHYSAPPIIGGVEAVLHAHANVFLQSSYPVMIIVGRGEQTALPLNTELVLIPEIDSLHPQVLRLSAALEQGQVLPDFDAMVTRLAVNLSQVLSRFDHVIVHNVFTKHFNLPLTAALHRLLDEGVIRHCIAWCHDFTWSSPTSCSKVHPGYPWDLLRTYRSDVTYVVVSQQRQHTLASLLNCPPDRIHVVYNGVDPTVLFGLSPVGCDLINQLRLLECDLVLLMPVRVTRAKNIEYALQVMAALKARGCRSKLIITGPPDPHDIDSINYFRYLQGLRLQLNVEDEARFIFESSLNEPLFIDTQTVGDLFRVSDIMFMPSHREGFGMPVLEAGLTGLLVMCTDVPAAKEIGGEDLTLIDLTDDPVHTADRILDWSQHSGTHKLRCRIRQNYSWPAIFHREIEPLLIGTPSI
jgi:glycosyltransferase involved in cell wall biosynthesis